MRKKKGMSLAGYIGDIIRLTQIRTHTKSHLFYSPLRICLVTMLSPDCLLTAHVPPARSPQSETESAPCAPRPGSPELPVLP